MTNPEEHKTDTRVYPAILARQFTTCLNAGELERAVEFALRILHHAEKSEALLKIVMALLARGDIDTAIPVAEKIPDYTERSEALEEIVLRLIARDRLDEAVHLVGKIDYEVRKSHACTQLATAMAQAGRLEEAEQFYTQAMDVPGIVRVYDFEFLIPNVDAFVDHLPWQRALSLCGRMEDASEQVHALCRIARRLAGTTDSGQIPAILRQAATTAQQTGEPAVRVLRILEVAEQMLQTGQGQEARQIVQEELLRLETEEFFNKTESLALIARWRARMGEA